jgi:rare lipoprotein A
MRRAQRHLLTMLTPCAVAGAFLAIPTAGLAAGGSAGPSGGAGLSGSPSGSSGSSGSTNPLVHPADATLTASGDGITVETVESGLLSRRLRFSGTAASSDAGMRVEIERATNAAEDRWTPVAGGPVRSDGAFAVLWRANRMGRVTVRAVLVRSFTTATQASAGRPASSTGAAAPAPSGPATPAVTVTVYQPGLATFYGPGFFGRLTACGQTLRPATLGVASRTLKCGTRVTVLFGGKSIVVPVIDRGPYANHASWDLTEATAKALGMTGTATVGALFAR